MPKISMKHLNLFLPGAAYRFQCGLLGASKVKLKHQLPHGRWNLDFLIHLGRVAILPGGLDAIAPGMAIAAFGDRPQLDVLAGRVLGREQSEETHQLTGRIDAGQISDLGKKGAGIEKAHRARPAAH